MRFAVIAQRPTPTNVALAGCLVPGVESLLLTPAQALVRLQPGDVALGRLDVLHSLDGIEPGERLSGRQQERLDAGDDAAREREIRRG